MRRAAYAAVLHLNDLLVVPADACNVRSVDVDGRHIVGNDGDLEAMVERL